MDTIPEPFFLCNQPARVPSKTRGFRVPFGVRDGRVWAPGEVVKGKACGCVCPGCGQLLVAKALTSRRRRPHFAHLGATDCHTGRETGIHLRAKQVIVERAEILLPAWDGDLLDMPNPPRARDEAGSLHEGRKVDYPAVRSALQDLETERRFGSYQPDVVAWDGVGELLIEIRVTHAVDDPKAARVKEHGRRMVEIDLSHLHRDTPHDPEAFDEAVLFDVSNRQWISCPDAVAEWQEAKCDLDRMVAGRNAELARECEAQARALETPFDRDKASRREYVRRRERGKYADELARLKELTARERVNGLLEECRASGAERVGELLEAVPANVKSVCERAHPDAWVFGVDPVLWQLLAFERFVGGARPGSRFNQKDVARWVRYSFPYEKALYRLFATQYGKRAEARRAGFSKRRLGYWVFTEEENSLIPNFYTPVNDFMARLAGAGVIRKLPELGEWEVCVGSMTRGAAQYGRWPIAPYSRAGVGR